MSSLIIMFYFDVSFPCFVIVKVIDNFFHFHKLNTNKLFNKATQHNIICIHTEQPKTNQTKPLENLLLGK